MAVDDPLEVLAERQAARNGTSAITDAADARTRLEALLGLEQPGIRIQAVHLFGSGTETTLRIDLSTGDDLRFEPADSMVRPQTVSARVALAVGVAIHPKQPQCIEALSLARQLAEMVAAYTEIDQARDWGSEYLQAASTCEFDSRNQAHRFAAFKMLAGRDPHTHFRGETCTLAQAGIVLRDTDGGRLVRSSWFLEHVRSNAPRVSHKHLPTLMHEAGWARPKRIKATSPGSGEQLIWAFYTVPTGWDDDLEQVTR